MKREEIIKMLRVCADDGIICPACPRYEQYEYGGTAECREKLMQEAADALEAAIREQEERENKRPLTLDELMEMDGEPVWLKIAGGVWGLVDMNVSVVWLNRGGDIDLDKIAGLAYRSKPKEDA